MKLQDLQEINLANIAKHLKPEQKVVLIKEAASDLLKDKAYKNKARFLYQIISLTEKLS